MNPISATRKDYDSIYLPTLSFFDSSLSKQKVKTHQPFTTPSTLSIGTILKTNLDRKALAVSESPSRQPSVPSITQDALLSPGCTRAVRNIISLSCQT